MNGLKMVLVVCGLVASAAATPFKNCGTRSDVTALEVVGCDVLPCVLKRGSSITLNAQLLSDVYTEGLVSNIAGIINGLPVPFSNDDKACDSLTSGKCPLSVGDVASFSTSVDVLQEYPPIAVTIQWKLKDDSGSDMACILIPAHIQ